MKRLDKAHRVFQYMRNTIAFFWDTVKNILDNLGFSPEIELLIREFLIPAHYLKIAASKAGSAKEKHCLEALSKMLLVQFALGEQRNN